MYTIIALFKDGTRYEVARYLLDSEVIQFLDKIKKTHIYRYARFEIITEDENND